MFRKIIWPAMILLSAVMVGVFIFGFARVMAITDADRGNVESMTDQSDRPQSIYNDGDTSSLDVSEPDSDERVILIIGDSIGAGVGDERNLGMGERFVSKQAYEVSDLYEVVNFSVPGAETQDLSEKVVSGEIDEAIDVAELILISIGGNDINRIRNADTTLQIVEFEETLGDHIVDLKTVLDYIREMNQVAEIVVLGLYNPYGDSTKAEDQRLLQEWNYQTRLAVLEVENANIVPLYDLFENHLEQLLSIDQFHPSGEGYELIAEMIDEVIETK